MALRLTEAWTRDAQAKIDGGQPIDYTSVHNIGIQWLVVRLSKAGRAYKIYQLGAGVKRLTTDTTVCPCCKKPI